MKILNFILVIFVLTACGGGGSDAIESAVTDVATEEATNAANQAAEEAAAAALEAAKAYSNKVRVIDGYITGANVFIDFNYNLKQDTGEPSAVASTEDGLYEFDFDNDFTAITDFSSDCAKNRIQIAQVSVGATDAELGTVNKAFTMYNIPYSGNFVNITPFTGMFIDVLRSARTELEGNLGMEDNESLQIKVADGCGSIANALASKIASRSSIFAAEMNTKGYAVLKDLYGDYVANLDNQTKQKAETVVDFLKTADDIRAVVKAHFNNKYEPSVALSEEATDLVFGENNITALPLSININHVGEADSDGWSDVMTYSTSGVNVLQNGKIAKVSCTETDANNCDLFDPTYANIKKNFDWYWGYGGSENKTIIDGTITSHFRESRQINDEGATSCSQAAKLDLQGTKSCSGAGCPTSIRYEYEITHNKGFQALEGCDVSDNPYVYAFTQLKTETNDGEDHYGLQYSLKDGSQIYNNPPTNFLGAGKANVDYLNAFNKLEELLVSLDDIDPISTKLITNEFISIFRNLTQKTDGETTSGNRYNLVISRNSDGGDLSYKCTVAPWDSGINYFNFDNQTETTGDNAFTTCYNDLITFTIRK